MKMNYNLIDNVEVDGINTSDYPDFCDAFISYAEYNEKPMTDNQLNELNEDDQLVFEYVESKLY